MTRTVLIKKLTSRKFWLTIAAFVTEMILAFHGDAEIAETISGCIMAGAAVIAYIIGEGLADSAAAGSSTSSTAERSPFTTGDGSQARTPACGEGLDTSVEE